LGIIFDKKCGDEKEINSRIIGKKSNCLNDIFGVEKYQRKGSTTLTKPSRVNCYAA